MTPFIQSCIASSCHGHVTTTSYVRRKKTIYRQWRQTHIIHNTYKRFGTKPIFADVYYQYYHYYYYHLSIAIAFSFSFYFPDPQEWLWHHQIIIKSASHVLCIDNIDTLEFRMWLLESSSLLSFEMDFLFLCICYDVHYTLLCYEIDEK